MSTAISNLARAEQNHADAVQKVEAASAARHALVERLAQRTADADAAIADHRRGELDEATAALRRQVAELDARDLDGLIQQEDGILAVLTRQAATAAADLQHARQAVQVEQRQAELVALQVVAAELQEKLLGVVAEAVAIWRELNPRSMRVGSASTVFQPSGELRNLVVANDVPRRRTP